MAQPLTEREARVMERIHDVSGKWVRWERRFFLCNTEPVTRQVKGLHNKGYVDLWEGGISGPQISITDKGRAFLERA